MTPHPSVAIGMRAVYRVSPSCGLRQAVRIRCLHSSTPAFSVFRPRSQFGVYGKIMAAFTIGGASFVYVINFAGCLGAWQYNEGMLAFAAVLQTIISIPLLALIGFTSWGYFAVRDLGMQDSLERDWIDYVALHPRAVCAVSETSGRDQNIR